MTELLQTYSVKTPRSTARRLASCPEVNCAGWANGFALTADTSTPLGRQQAAYIRQDKTRKHTETTVDGVMIRFSFEPGQSCFLEHSRPMGLADAQMYIVRKGNSTPFVHQRPEDWVEDFQEHVDKVASDREKG